MKILEVTVRFSVQNKAEEEKVYQFLNVHGSQPNIPKDKRVEVKEPGAYTPSSDRTRLAAEALSKCKRVGVLRLEVLEVWASAYPHVDLANEIAKCEAWAESKGVTRTPRGWQAALNSWLNRAQNTTRGPQQGLTAPSKTVTPITPEAETKAWLEAAA